MRSSFKIIIRVVTVLVRNQRFLPSEKIRAVNFQGILEAIFFSNKGQFSNLSCEHNWSASPFVDLSIPIVHPLAAAGLGTSLGSPAQPPWVALPHLHQEHHAAHRISWCRRARGGIPTRDRCGGARRLRLPCVGARRPAPMLMLMFSLQPIQNYSCILRLLNC